MSYSPVVTTLRQDHIRAPGWPQTIEVRCLALDYAASLQTFWKLDDDDGSTSDEEGNPKVLGIAVTHDSSGNLEYIFLSTQTRVYAISVLQYQTIPAAFKHLLSGSQPILVGFNMSRLAIYIHTALENSRVRCADLSTLLSNSDIKGWQPSQFLADRMGLFEKGDFGRRFEVDHLWHHGTMRDDGEKSYREGCLRAWISARCGKCLPMFYRTTHSLQDRTKLFRRNCSV